MQKCITGFWSVRYRYRDSRIWKDCLCKDASPDSGPSPPELDRLSNIIRAFNDLFGDIARDDTDRVRQLIIETIPSRVAVDTAFRNARQNSDEENARIEHDRALLRVMTSAIWDDTSIARIASAAARLLRVMTSVMKDDTELFKQFMDNEGFKRWMTDTVFGLACELAGAP